MCDQDGLDRDELEDHSGYQPSEGVASALHGAVALLQSLHAQRAAVPAALASWQAVYGTAVIEPNADDLQSRLRARRPQTIPDAFMAGASAMGEAMSSPTSVFLGEQLAAHVRLENELVHRLAEVTGRPVQAVLAYLDEWAAAETGEAV
jgi:hypothetical protein